MGLVFVFSTMGFKAGRQGSNSLIKSSVEGANLSEPTLFSTFLTITWPSTTFCKKLLREAKVSTTPGNDFGPTGQGHLRLSFCVSEDMINKAFDRMDEFF